MRLVQQKTEFRFLKRYSVGGCSHREPGGSPGEAVASQSSRAISGQPAFRLAHQQRRGPPIIGDLSLLSGSR